jgi:L,D-peptidoglycan transpeptidase YkuD (ErfK/YbiS/YcfS/YnhG family)
MFVTWPSSHTRRRDRGGLCRKEQAMTSKISRNLLVGVLRPAASRGWISLGSLRLPCALGRGGIRARKREGDGATPLGRFSICRVYYRADRLPRPRAPLPVSPLRPSHGWCDAPSDRNYNRPVTLPYPASAERMWREDGLYDIVVVLDHNQRPRKRAGGSAVFMHIARSDYAPTAGCVALARQDLGRLLARISRATRLVLGSVRRPPAKARTGPRRRLGPAVAGRRARRPQ